MKRQTLQIRVSGLVQGVGYRRWAWIKAVSLGIDGQVRNLSDGWVEILAQAEDTALRTFLELLREGPRLAKVTGLEVEPYHANGLDWRRFEVR
ncbi:MAG: acylphosphatase [Coprothermobacterota bacterium]|nr:acylphosphatase [Coprothermobacterota bacterium]